MSALEITVFVAYAFLLACLSVYGVHRYVMAFLYYRHKYKLPTPAGRFAEPPRVTVQLPIFNEMYVTERLIDAVAKLEWPRDRFEIQVLDDSTDETTAIARACVERHAATGLDITYVHRTNRKGFKAGALENGLATAKGEFVAVFDADFIPAADYLQKAIPHFAAPDVAVVQARWGHLNRDYSLLSNVEAVMLDGHFVIEHGARSRSGRFFNFNGTAGIWRRKAIEESGGWQHDTITEDLDLSYRAQLRGWRFVYLKDLVVPAELPVEMNAFKAQQHRWAKGSIQVALKVLPLLRQAKTLPGHVRSEAWMHLTANLAYLLMIPLSIMLPVTVVVRVSHGALEVLFFDLPMFALASFSVALFYVASQVEQGRGAWNSIKHLPAVMALGIGLSVNQARAVVEALMGYETGFVRTPKLGEAAQKGAGAGAIAKKRYKGLVNFQPIVELGLAAYMTYGVMFLIEREEYWSLPFLILFQVGFAWVGLTSVYEGLRGTVVRWARALAPAAAASGRRAPVR